MLAGVGNRPRAFIMDYFQDNEKERSQFTAIPMPLPEEINRKKVLPELTSAEYWQLRNVQAALDSLRESCYLCYDKLIDFHTGSEEELSTLIHTYEQQEKNTLQGIASSLDSLGQICPVCYDQLLSRYTGIEDSLKQIITLGRVESNPFKSN
jgi:hypothetical protein